MKINNQNYREWIRAALIRAVRTIAQTALAMISVTGITGIEDINWLAVASSSALAGIISVLTSIVTGLPEINR